MRFHWLLLVALVACSSTFGQSFEAAVGGGQSVFPGNTADIGTATTDPASGTYKMKDGFRLVFRMAIGQGRFFGHEFGYAYSRTSLDTPAVITSAGTGLPGQTGIVTTIPAQTMSLPSHQGFYDFLVYGIPEDKRVRPFVAGGVQFTAFSQPGSQYTNNRETKYGINYGGGIKIRVKDPWGMRLDVRQYNMGKPFNLPNASGRLLMWEFSGSVSFFL
jgi:hypothetical protein